VVPLLSLSQAARSNVFQQQLAFLKNICMKLLKVEFNNFKIFEHISVDLSKSNMVVFIGENGKGKTSLLEGVALLLSELVLNMSPTLQNKNLKDIYNINKNSNHAKLSAICQLEYNNKAIWHIELNSIKNEVDITRNNNDIVNFLKDKINAKFPQSLPILAFYRSERFLNTMPSKNKFSNKRNADIEELYKNILQAQTTSFIEFVTWFRLEEDKENENMRRSLDFGQTNFKLEVIRRAIALFFSKMHDQQYSQLHIIRQEDANLLGELVIEKNNIIFPVNKLSDGERILLLLVADIARQLAVLNIGINSGEYLLGSGIVLIDEIELHLHPAWQRKVIPALQQTFPNIQFLITTHSPQIISEVRTEDIFILSGGEIFKPATNPIGRDSNDILSEIMQISLRPSDIEQLISEYFLLINQNKFDIAEKFKNKLLEKLDSNDPIFFRAQALIDRKRILNK
jgi:predicted ATP-binding protein involved in virulence